MRKQTIIHCALCGAERIAYTTLAKLCLPCVEKRSKDHRKKDDCFAQKLEELPNEAVVYCLEHGMLSTLTLKQINKAGINDLSEYKDYCFPERGPAERYF